MDLLGLGHQGSGRTPQDGAARPGEEAPVQFGRAAGPSRPGFARAARMFGKGGRWAPPLPAARSGFSFSRSPPWAADDLLKLLEIREAPFPRDACLLDGSHENRVAPPASAVDPDDVALPGPVH